MTNVLLTFANELLSTEQMKAVKGGFRVDCGSGWTCEGSCNQQPNGTWVNKLVSTHDTWEDGQYNVTTTVSDTCLYHNIE